MLFYFCLILIKLLALGGGGGEGVGVSCVCVLFFVLNFYYLLDTLFFLSCRPLFLFF